MDIRNISSMYTQNASDGRHRPQTKPIKAPEQQKTELSDVQKALKHPEGKGLFVDTTL